MSSLVFGLLWWGSTRLQHPLHEIEPDSGLALVLADGKVIGHVVVAHIAGQGVSLLVGQPLVLGGVCMSCTDVLALKMLQLAVDVVPVPHSAN